MPRNIHSKRIISLFILLIGISALVGWLQYKAPLLSGTTVRVGVNVVQPITRILDVTSPNGNGTYTAGQTLLIKVQFDQIVHVNTASGTATIALNSGGKGIYHSGGGTDSLLFSYTIQSNEFTSALDIASSTALVLHGSTIRNSQNVHANTALPPPGSAGSLKANKNITITLLSASHSSNTIATKPQKRNNNKGPTQKGTSMVHRAAPKKIQKAPLKKLQSVSPPKKSETTTLKRIQKLLGATQNRPTAAPQKSRVTTAKKPRSGLGASWIKKYTVPEVRLKVSVQHTGNNSPYAGLVARVQTFFQSIGHFVSYRIPAWLGNGIPGNNEDRATL